MMSALGRTLVDAQAILSTLWPELSGNRGQDDSNLETTQLPGQRGDSHRDRRRKKGKKKKDNMNELRG